MRVVLLRHGIAVDREDPGCPPDAERPLTPQGHERTQAAALGLARLDVKPVRIVTSPYRRARETADVVAHVLGVPARHVVESDLFLPEAPAAPAAASIEEEFRAAAGELLIVGHAPNLDVVIAALLGSSRTVTSLKKAGAAALDLEEEGGVLRWIVEPRALRRLGR